MFIVIDNYGEIVVDDYGASKEHYFTDFETAKRWAKEQMKAYIKFFEGDVDQDYEIYIYEINPNLIYKINIDEEEEEYI